mmetsp:Transcript_11738/g.11665  ORF Transcript_11738/g.11665 Transcript_11738/m.11665 type:complete len:158 (-) Transcript_11738:157-630(-)
MQQYENKYLPKKVFRSTNLFGEDTPGRSQYQTLPENSYQGKSNKQSVDEVFYRTKDNKLRQQYLYNQQFPPLYTSLRVCSFGSGGTFGKEKRDKIRIFDHDLARENIIKQDSSPGPAQYNIDQSSRKVLRPFHKISFTKAKRDFRVRKGTLPGPSSY